MKTTLYRLFGHQYLSKEEAQNLLREIAAGRCNDAELASFMTVFLMRSISVDELLGFRQALLEMAVPLDPLRDFDPIDIVGTGGDNKNSFNISTCACFIVAGAGEKVVKHGNYGATSISGASNVIENCGARFHASLDIHQRSLEKAGIAYLHAQLFNPALKNVAGVRKALGVRNFFNMLGPIVNPIQPRQQLLGVYDLKLARLYHYICEQATNRFTIVHSLDGYDEISLTDAFKTITHTEERLHTPQELGLPRCRPEEIYGGATPLEAMHIFRRVLANEGTPAQRNVVLANAAFALRTCKPALSLPDALAAARESLESGRAENCLRQFLSINQ